MAEYKISNLSIRIEDQVLPAGVLVGHGKHVGDLGDVEAEAEGCGCSCTCTCTCSCTCTCTGTSPTPPEPAPEDPAGEGGRGGKFENVELALLRESLKNALENLTEIERNQAKRPAG